MHAARSIDDHISGFPRSTQKLLQQVRRAIRKAAPEAQETIKYGIPTYVLNGNLVHFAGYEHHIGFYPTPSAVKAFRRELSRYEQSKGAVRFSLDKPLPLDLIRRIVEFRVAQSVPRNPFEALAAPAQRALAGAGIASLKQLSRKTEREVSQLHGMGPSAMTKLGTIVRRNGLKFKRR